MDKQSNALELAEQLEDTESPRLHLLPYVAIELRRLSSFETELLAMRRVFSEAGCTFDVNYIRRLVRAEARCDALLEALQDLCDTLGECGMTEKARAAIKAMEEEK